MNQPSTSAEPSTPDPGALRGGLIFCENCGAETLHRVLKAASHRSARVEGLARCNDCRWTHPFTILRPSSSTIRQITSVGPNSKASSLALPGTERLQVGQRVPDSIPPVRILRIDARTGRTVSSERVDRIAAVWVTPDEGASVPVSIVEGRRTRPARVTLPPQTPLTVGAGILVDGDRLFIAALRARGHTWRREGDSFEATEVQRVYGRRTSIPPAGSSDWRRERDIPSSRARSISRSSRSRSRPGVNRNRTFPQDRTAAAGATVHSRSPL